MNTDKPGLKTNHLPAFILVHRRPEMVFHHPHDCARHGLS
jgi:hypothetical protein